MSPNTDFRHARARIVRGFGVVAGRGIAGDVLFGWHGAVGTLLFCHFAGLPISRTQDQIAGGGCYRSADSHSLRALHGWRRMEDPRL